ncbi:MAG: glycosyltransferase family 4 protein [Caulobacteraceae bacterium]
MTKPAHVLMTADAVGGVWTYALDLSRGLAAADVRVTLAVLGPPPSPAQTLAAQAVDGLEVVATDLPLDWLAEGPAPVLQASRALAALASDRHVDLVHLNSPALANARFAQPVLGACHSCVGTWWDAAGSGALSSNFQWRIKLLADGYRACDTLIAPSQAFAAATAAAYPGARPQVVYNGRPAPAAPSSPRETRAITVGRLWDAGKNLSVLDQAAPQLAQPVLAIGPVQGPNGEQVEARHVRLLGVLAPEAVAAQVAASAVFVSLALYEPFGLAVLEAAQAGCALVLSDIPTFRELWGEAAVFVDPASPDAAAARMRELLDDADACALWGAAAQQRARRYTLDAMTEATLAAYAAILQGQEARVA